MKYRNEILEVIKGRDVAVSVKGIVHFANIDAPSEVLREIRDECFEMVEEGVLVAFDHREDENGGLFFDIVR